MFPNTFWTSQLHSDPQTSFWTQKSNQNLPQTLPKPSQALPKSFPNPPKTFSKRVKIDKKWQLQKKREKMRFLKPKTGPTPKTRKSKTLPKSRKNGLKSHWFLACIFQSIFVDFWWILEGFQTPQTKDFDATLENAHLGENLQKPAKNLGFYSILGNIC